MHKGIIIIHGLIIFVFPQKKVIFVTKLPIAVLGENVTYVSSPLCFFAFQRVHKVEISGMIFYNE